MRYPISMVTVLLLTLACQDTPQTNYKPLNLLPHGLPITIQAPEGVKINMEDMGVMKDITVVEGLGHTYNVQIFSSAANTINFQQVKNEHLEEIKSREMFTKLIEESPNGFIYEQQIDSTHIGYGFKYVHIQGDQEFIFQNGILGIFKLEDIKNMYRAVQQGKQ